MILAIQQRRNHIVIRLNEPIAMSTTKETGRDQKAETVSSVHENSTNSQSTPPGSNMSAPVDSQAECQSQDPDLYPGDRAVTSAGSSTDDQAPDDVAGMTSARPNIPPKPTESQLKAAILENISYKDLFALTKLYQDLVSRPVEVSGPLDERPHPDGQPASIWRTVIAEDGNLHNRRKTYYAFDEESYNSISDAGLTDSAIELVKEVKIIPKSQDQLQHRQRGNKALQGHIVEEIKEEKIVVRSPLLCKAIREMVYWPSLTFSGGTRHLEIRVPYRSIGTHRSEFQVLQEHLEASLERSGLRDNTLPSGSIDPATTNAINLVNQNSLDDNRKLLNQLKLFLGQVDRTLQEGLEGEKERIAKGMITFDYLWKILTPGVFAYCRWNRDIDEEIACQVRLLTWTGGNELLGRESSEDYHRSVIVHVWYIDHRGIVLLKLPRYQE